MRPAAPLAAVTLALTLTLAGAGCGSEPAAPAYVGQWEGLVPDQGGAFRDRYNVNPDGTFWLVSWWEPQGGGSLFDGADRGTVALTGGTEVAGTLTFHRAQTYDLASRTWGATSFDWTFGFTLDTTLTPRALRRDNGRVYAYVGPPTASPPLPPAP